VLLSVNIGAFLAATYGVGDNYDSSDSSWVTGLTITQYSALSLFAVTWGVGVYQARVNMTPRLTTELGRDTTFTLRDPGLALPAASGMSFALTF
jgi:hypothetical protein